MKRSSPLSPAGAATALLALLAGCAGDFGFASELAASSPPPAAAPEQPAPAAPAWWQQVVVLGASASDGYGTEGEGAGRLRLADVLETLLPQQRQPVLSAATDLFFAAPQRYGPLLLAQVQAARPSLVLAVDYLFWFVYGAKSAEQRLADLAQGLALLDQLPCPIVVCDVPDMRGAVRTRALGRRMVPAPETLEEANRRIRSWAEQRPRVVFLPLAELLPEWIAGGAAAPLVQKDALHPTVLGLVTLAVEALRAVAGRQAAVPGDLLLDPDVAVRLLLGAERPAPAPAAARTGE